ncbi:hypothetical protein [Natronosalvus amylolyticus]|uniref:hypothetical protein n=1 Tax=Natronosalvus amylolyticus TaxID=2961994 RepID=UPI0020C977FA|nr:hypothetical protein [Natronosalvus amylolyticus]
MNKTEKFVLIIYCGIISILVATQYVERSIYPYFPISSVFVFLLLIYAKNVRVKISLIIICTYGALYPLLIHVITPSLLGNDPDRFAIWVQQVINIGEREAIGSAFYSDAPFMLLHSAMTSTVSGIFSYQSLYLFSIIIGICLPILAKSMFDILPTHIPEKHYIPILVLLPLSASVVTYSTNPIGQTASFIYFIFIVFIIFKYMSGWDIRYFILLMVISHAIMFSHKVTLFIIFSIFLLVALHWILIIDSGSPSKIPIVSMIIAALFFLQWFQVTGYASRGLNRILAGLFFSSSDVQSYTPVMAISNESLLFTQALYGGHIIILLAIGGFAWAIVLMSILFEPVENNTHTYFLLYSSAVTVAFTIFSYLSSTINPHRLLYMAEPLVIILIGIALYEFPSYKRLTHMLILFLLLSQVFAGSALPDIDRQNTDYLTEKDKQVIQFHNNHINGSTYADHGLIAQSPHSEIVTSEGPDRQNRFISYPNSILNGSISLSNHSAIYREDRYVYRASTGSTWRLQWEIVIELEKNNKIYSSDTNHIYRGHVVAGVNN